MTTREDTAVGFGPWLFGCLGDRTVGDQALNARIDVDDLTRLGRFLGRQLWNRTWEGRPHYGLRQLARRVAATASAVASDTTHALRTIMTLAPSLLTFSGSVLVGIASIRLAHVWEYLSSSRAEAGLSTPSRQAVIPAGLI